MACFSICSGLSRELAAQDSLAKFEAQYELERDPVVKAKILAKDGRLELDQVRADLKTNNEEQALSDLEHYRDEVELAVKALSTTGLNAEKHPGGFKELQISLRQTLRSVDDVIDSLPYDKRPWFQAVRSDLAKSQATLMDQLFPDGGNKGPKRADP
jgi:hypothetical protein